MAPVRIIVADCSAEYSGRLNASLPPARRVLLIKADMSCLIFSELGSYKPLNWMCAPCTIREIEPEEASQDGAGAEADSVAGTGPDEVAEVAAPDALIAQEQDQDQSRPVRKVLRVSAVKSSDVLTIRLYQVYADDSYDLGEDPGLVKDGVEAHLQRYLAEQIGRIGPGATLVRREYPTPIGPVDIMAVDGQGRHVAIEIKRHGGIDGVEQLTRYCRLLNRDPLLAPVRGIFAAQTITPQARVLAEDRGFECLILDYEAMKGADSDELTLF
nr:endonuclease NucS [Bifidobacterium polysaccharolyticum]